MRMTCLASISATRFFTWRSSCCEGILNSTAARHRDFEVPPSRVCRSTCPGTTRGPCDSCAPMLRATQPFFVNAIGVVKQAPPTLRSWSRPLTGSCGSCGQFGEVRELLPGQPAQLDGFPAMDSRMPALLKTGHRSVSHRQRRAVAVGSDDAAFELVPRVQRPPEGHMKRLPRLKAREPLAHRQRKVQGVIRGPQDDGVHHRPVGQLHRDRLVRFHLAGVRDQVQGGPAPGRISVYGIRSIPRESLRRRSRHYASIKSMLTVGDSDFTVCARKSLPQNQCQRAAKLRPNCSFSVHAGRQAAGTPPEFRGNSLAPEASLTGKPALQPCRARSPP